ncbi:hypothetical protein BDQ17DRAFT_1247170 [Cyathus striatus]|nr:hypothetical protein BDQ17DRAFT_1247170 [Cyathus striatus]
MLIHIIIYLFLRNASLGQLVEASPIRNTTSNYTLPLSLVLIDTTTHCNSNQRSVLKIIWSCISTLFLCTWVSAHPNVPAPDDEDWRILWRRIKTMYWAVVVPELVLTWAYRQRSGAKEIYEMYKEYNWTMEHAHLLQMGGFHLRDGDRTTVIYPNHFSSLLIKRKIAFPKVTGAEINDKSKATVLSKLIVVIQTLWFFMQCIGRWAQGLPVSQLEVTTLAVVSCTIMTSIIWLNKPFDVQEPFYLDKTSEMKEVKRDDEVGIVDTTIIPHLGGYSPGNITYEISLDTISAIHQKSTFKALLGTVSSIYTTISTEVSKLLRKEGVLSTLLTMTLVWGIISPIIELLSYSHFGADEDISKSSSNANRVSSYYVYLPSSEGTPTEKTEKVTVWQWVTVLSLPTSTAALFGLVHCIAWNAHFPSYTEQILWQVSSIAVASLLTIFVLLIFFFMPHITALTVVFDIVLIGLLMVYVAARYYLLLEGLASLRSLPSAGLQVVGWVDFIPHI